MSRLFKDFHPGLLQRVSTPAAGLSGLRPALPAGLRATEPKQVFPARAGSRLGILLTLAAIALSLWIADGKDALLARLGYRGVPPLPEPSAALSLDDQARYWTYALYDFEALKRTYGVSGYYAIDGAGARGRLERLLPRVSNRVIGEISGYTSIAFHSAPRSRVRP